MIAYLLATWTLYIHTCIPKKEERKDVKRTAQEVLRRLFAQLVERRFRARSKQKKEGTQQTYESIKSWPTVLLKAERPFFAWSTSA